MFCLSRCIIWHLSKPHREVIESCCSTEECVHWVLREPTVPGGPISTIEADLALPLLSMSKAILHTGLTGWFYLMTARPRCVGENTQRAIPDNRNTCWTGIICNSNVIKCRTVEFILTFVQQTFAYKPGEIAKWGKEGISSQILLGSNSCDHKQVSWPL